MANELQELICWPSPGRLVMGIQIRNLAGQLHSENEDFIQIDTGYSEEILLPYDLFEQLNLQRWRLMGSMPRQGTTVTGQVIDFIEAHAEVIIPRADEEYPVIVQTFTNNSRFLIGRAFLRHFKMLLDGPGEQVCLSLPVF
jgi:predicted aspartyl protease